MSTKSRPSVDDAIIERRLRPIYDWLDNGNNKKAVQEADKVLRKQPNLQCASVLKALALLRLGKNNESSQVIESIVAIGTTDDAALQALTICYREMHQPELICTAYEKASKLDPSNEDIMSHLFMSYVRVSDYKKQQQTAMQLYKLKPKNPYYFWAIMSIIMQSHVTSDSSSRKVCLQLAERMILKFVDEDKIDSETEVLTYLYALEIQDKYEEALTVIEGTLAKRITQQQQNFVSMKKAEYHTQLKRCYDASLIYMELLKQEQDNWQHYVHFTESVLSNWVSATSSFGNNEKKNDPLVEASQFLKETREKALENCGLERSPLLGCLQLALKLREHSAEDRIYELCGDITDQVYVYIKQYGDKTCCFGDIVNFLPLIPTDNVSELLEKVRALIEFEENVPVDIRNMYRHQIWLQLQRSLGAMDNLSPDQLVEFADDLISVYEKTANFSCDMVQTDTRPHDTYLMLASHSLFSVLPHFILHAPNDCSLKQPQFKSAIQLLIKLCAVLEYGINVSKANFQLKLLLIKAYNLIGATSAAYKVYEKLDLKQIQMDTMGHVLAFRLLDSGCYSLASDIFSATLKFFMANYKETSDPLIMSYKFGSLTRIPEFVEFRERLNNSLHFATVTAEQMLLQLTTGGNSKSELEALIDSLNVDPANENTNWEELKDNRDLYVMNSWEPEERKLKPSCKRETFSDEVFFLKIRNLMLRIVCASYNLRRGVARDTNSNKYENKNVMLNGESNGVCHDRISTVMKELVDNLRSEAQVCDKYSAAKPPKIPLQGPDIPRVYTYSKGHYLQTFLNHSEALLKAYDCTQGSEGMDAWSGDIMKTLTETTDVMLNFQSSHLELFEVSPLTALPGVNAQPIIHLTHFVQTVSLIVILLECCNSLLIPIKSSVAKRNKKKKGNVAMPEIVSHFNNYISSFSAKLEDFETTVSGKLNKLKNEAEFHNDSSNIVISKPLISNLDEKIVCENIKSSFDESFTNLSGVLKNKLKFLISLKV